MTDPGDSDFSSIFASAGEERREREERRELERMMQLLDERAPAAIPNHANQHAWNQQQQQQWPQWGPPMQPIAGPSQWGPWAGPWAAPSWAAPSWAAPSWAAPSWAWGAPWAVSNPAWAPDATGPPRIENLRVLASGDIDREDDDKPEVDHAHRVHTLDDLPRESLFDLFPVPEPVEEPPPITIQSGRRLRDGKMQHTIALQGFEPFSWWSGLAPETVLAVCSAVAVVALLMMMFALGRMRAALLGSHTRAEEARAAHNEHVRATDALAIEQAIERAVDRALERRLVPPRPLRCK